MPQWIEGQSGNPRGRPKAGSSIAELARAQVEKHKLIETLANIGAHQKEYANVDVGEQLRAIQLLLSYGYGPPRAEIEANERLLIEVVYVERNSVAITSPLSGPATGDSAGIPVQRGLLRSTLGQDGTGNEPPDSSGAPR